MAELVIIEKLRHEVQEEIVSERQVVYILVEIRKHLELLKNPLEFKDLKFFCDWVLHTKLEQQKAQAILALFNQTVYISFNEIPETIANEINKFMAMDGFREQLRIYLKQFGLATTIVDHQWFSFWKNYMFVITDCPLIVKKQGRNLLKISKVILNLEVLAPHESQKLTFQISWKIFSENVLVGNRGFSLILK